MRTAHPCAPRVTATARPPILRDQESVNSASVALRQAD